MVLGPDGAPLDAKRNGHAPNGRETKVAGGAITVKSLLTAVGTLSRSFWEVDQDPAYKTQSSYRNHGWVYVAASLRASAASQPPFTVFRDTDAEVTRRTRVAKAAGRAFQRRYGRARTAMRRHASTMGRVVRKGMEPDEDHEVAVLIQSPNPLVDSTQLFYLTFLYLHLQGEAFWVKTNYNGEERLYAYGGQCFEPILEHRTWGELIGWWYSPPATDPNYSPNQRVPLDLTEVIQFKVPDPENPLRGMSKIAAATSAIRTDLVIDQKERKLLERGGVPRATLVYEGRLSPDDQREYMRRWTEKYEGPGNEGRTAILDSGFKYQPIEMSARDMEQITRLGWNREQILACFNVPPSAVGLTEFTNYATALAQDRGFWDKAILVDHRLVESKLDQTIFFEYPDDVFGMFDLHEVEALRVGYTEKLEQATKLSSSVLHVPPRESFDAVGLEVPDYPYDDEVLVTGLVSTLTAVIEAEQEPPPEPPPVPPPPGADEPQDGDGSEPPPTGDAPPVPPQEGEPAPKPSDGAARGPGLRRKARVPSWRQYVRVEQQLEDSFATRYRRWSAWIKRETLANYDRETKAHVPLSLILPDLRTTRNELLAQVRPVYAVITEATYEMMKRELGVLVFGIDDAALVKRWETMQTALAEFVPANLYENIGNVVRAGINNGESLAQIRVRMSQVLDAGASPAKVLQVARTETGSLMSGLRYDMLDLQQVTKAQWYSAEDENTREDHITFGQAGPQELGFNYLELAAVNGTDGVLEFPGDARAPAGQRINCRCFQGAAL